MNPGPPPVAGPPSGGDANPPVKKRRSLLLYGCGSLIVLMLVIVATVAITLWYLQRPIKPVVLSESEKVVVETKLERVGVEPGRAFSGTDSRSGTTPDSRRRAPSSDQPVIKVETDRTYVPGGKVLRLTERELNGLLNANTDLGKTVRFELDRDAINAYLAVPIPQDSPFMAGRIFRARGRFHVSLGDGSAPRAVLEDITVLGLSLPKEWLGGIKGQNLFDRVAGERNGRPLIKGVKSLRIEPGEIVLEVGE
jgi:hypothetical protein